MKDISKITIGLLLNLLFTASSVSACDMSAFVETEFAERCQKLIGYCQKAHITYLADYPDLDKRFNSLSKDWIDFYLSHGETNNKPPSMNFINDEVWKETMQELGKTIQSFIHKKITARQYECLILKIHLMQNEEFLSKLHNCFKASELCETDINKINDLSIWYDTRVLIPSEYVFEQIKGLNELEPELKSELESYKKELTHFMEITKETSPEIKQSLFNNINQAISKTMSKWERLFLFKP